MTLEDQIAGLLADRALLVGGLFADQDVAARLAGEADQRAATLARRLAGDDDREVAALVRDLVTLQWGDGEPEHAWWRTPLGRAAAGSVGRDDSETVTLAVAGAMLGFSRQRAHELAGLGQLDRAPDGRITRASVMARLAG